MADKSNTTSIIAKNTDFKISAALDPVEGYIYGFSTKDGMILPELAPEPYYGFREIMSESIRDK